MSRIKNWVFEVKCAPYEHRGVLCGPASIIARAMLAIGLILFAAFYSLQAAAAFKDPLDTPARMVSTLKGRPLQAVAKAGNRLVAVGARGLIIYSDDGGNSWKQSISPVQSDLVALDFPSKKQGWAVGFDGVVLHTKDAGLTWTKQFDGREALGQFTRFYKARAAAGDEGAKKGERFVKLNYGKGPRVPLLSVWFENIHRGFAVGAFGTIIATTDGGRTWKPWFERIKNDYGRHLNSIRGIDGGIYIAAEKGAVYRLDRTSGRFILHETGYAGSFFGITGAGKEIFAYGLSGTVYRSSDHGVTWTHLSSPTDANVTSGATLESGGKFILVTAANQLLLGNASEPNLTLKALPGLPARFTGVAVLPRDQLVITTLGGVATVTLSDKLKTR